LCSVERKFDTEDEKPKNLGFEPVHPKNVLLASVVHGISCLFFMKTGGSFDGGPFRQFGRQFLIMKIGNMFGRRSFGSRFSFMKTGAYV
jgi:hypothetical protein